ncbi:MAG: peptidylprolyl isomerase [Sphingobacteriaceae bacterium]
MGIMGFLRNRAGVIIVGLIGFSILAFLVSDAIRLGTPFWRANGNQVGEVAGQSIDIQEFNTKVEQNAENFKRQLGQSSLNPQMMAYVVDNTWNQTVSTILLEKEVNRLGLQVGKNELNDMISGKNPDQQVLQSFGDPKTGQINREQLNQFLANIDKQEAGSPLRQQWGTFLVTLSQNRLSQKYFNLINNSLYVTALEAREDYSQRNKLANFRFVNLDYAAIPDGQIKLTDDDYESYYDEHKYRFDNKTETRSFEYVVFNASPSKADSAEVNAKIAKLANDFRVSANDSLFVSINADTKTPVSYVRKGQLDPAVDSAVFKAGKGTMVGPIFSNGSYKLAKVLDIKVGPDSVSASHILLNPATEGGLDKAKAKADSIKKLIQNGANFAALAKQYSTDGSKDNGGDLGTFGRGAMVSAFEDAVFNGNTGDLKVITTQFGVHIIKIVAQKGSSKLVKVALVDKALSSGTKTQQIAYTQASAFLNNAKDAEAFDEVAQKSGYKKLIAQDVVGSQGEVAGLDNPRELIRWAYKADESDVSDQIFEIGDKFVVAKLTDVKEKGILPLAKVKKQIEPLVIKKVKAQRLLAKFEKALSGSGNIDQVAQKLGKIAVPVQNIVFANPVLPGVGQENKVVGAIFGSQPGKLSKAIEGDLGVYVYVVDQFSKPAPLVNAFKQKQQISQVLLQRGASGAFGALRDKADIKDNRVRFF